MILLPQTEHAPFDIVAYKNGVFKRVQVKYKSIDKKGSITVHFRSSWSDKSRFIGTKKVNKSEIDLYCIYYPETDSCYYLNPKEFDKSVTLRVEAPRNGQKVGIKFLSDHRRVP